MHILYNVLQKWCVYVAEGKHIDRKRCVGSNFLFHIMIRFYIVDITKFV